MSTIKRFEVISNFPKNPFVVGQIIETKTDLIYCVPNSDRYSDFPHLFRELKWWEGINIEDAPKYIKSDTQVIKPRWEVEKWRSITFLKAYQHDSDFITYILDKFTPATEYEYLNFTKNG